MPLIIKKFLGKNVVYATGLRGWLFVPATKKRFALFATEEKFIEKNAIFVTA